MSDRIDGWKAIGTHFGRDRSTVMRWAAARNLPVRRLPGGQRATVYALRSDLDQWLAGQRDLDDEAGDAPALTAVPPPRIRWRIIAAVAIVVIAIVGAIAALRSTDSAPRWPEDPALRQAYLTAREDWATREPEALKRAIRRFEAIIRRAPAFALAHAGLADAYLLAREFGAVDSAHAYHRAAIAADKAVRLDPALADAHRAIGFVRYWWDGDPPRAGAAFRRAIALAPGNAQTHFWYANILSDNGEHAAAMREFEAARRIEPASPAIRADYAWALWSAGREAEARAALDRLARDDPAFALVHDCLADIRLGARDISGYLDSATTFARLRGDRGEQARLAALDETMPRDPAAVRRAILAHAVAQARSDPETSYAHPAFVAASLGNRTALATILREADRRGDHWGQAGMVSRIAAFAMDDPALLALLAKRRRARAE